MTVHNHGIDPMCEETRTPDGLKGACILHETIRDQAAIRASWDGDCPDVTRIVRRVNRAIDDGTNAEVVKVVLDETETLRAQIKAMHRLADLFDSIADNYDAGSTRYPTNSVTARSVAGRIRADLWAAASRPS